MRSESSRSRRREAFVLLLMFFVAFRVEGQDVFTGQWVGTLEVRGGEVPVRLHVDQSAGGYVGRLDIPNLIFAQQPTVVSRVADTLVVTLPFEWGDARMNLVGRDTLFAKGEVRAALARADAWNVRSVPVSFGVAGPLIEGDLIVPPGEGPFPVMVLAAGAGNPTRSNWSYSSWADHFARLGVAAFIYDRRRDDEMKSDGSLYTLEDHAADFADAVNVIAQLPEVDTTRIGAMGFSRGVWISYTAAVQQPMIKHLAGTGGSASTFAVQDMQQAEAIMRRDTLPEADILQALAYLRRYFAVSEDLERWADFQPLIDRARAARWAEYVKLPSSTDGLKWYHAQRTYDPAWYLQRLQVPVFYAWGAEDRTVPAAPNIPAFELLLPTSTLARSQFKIYPRADHRLEIRAARRADGSIEWMRLPPEYLRDLCLWLSTQDFVTANACA